MNDTVSGGNHHKDADAQSSTPVDILDELTHLRDLAITADRNAELADAAYEAADEEYRAAGERMRQAAAERMNAMRDSHNAFAAFVNGLREHDYVQTADGLKPRDPQ